jgi:flavin-binding protein dodecin
VTRRARPFDASAHQIAIGGSIMADNVYKKVEVVGSSTTSIEEAIENALAKASKTLRHMGWFELVEIRGALKDGKVSAYQVGLKVGFTLED